MTLLKIITIIIITTVTIIMMMISTTIFQNITEKLEKIFCFHNFGSVIAAQGVISHPGVRKGIIKLQQIISKHKQAYIPTAI